MTRRRKIGLAGITLVGLAVATACAQQTTTPFNRTQSMRGNPPGMAHGQPGMRDVFFQEGGPVRQRVVSRTVYETVREPIPPEEVEAYNEFQQARKNLADSTDDAERRKASDAIRRYLEQQFDRDLKQREQDLQSIEERLKTLRQQLTKRQAAKDEIITLRLKTITNNAEGLGFPGDEVVEEQNGPRNFPMPISTSVRH